jgi:hypothetical protein
MFYRPNFCCNCGEKIERAEWTWSASRKFCELCQTEHRFHDWAPKVFAVVGVIVGTALITSFFRPSGSATPTLADARIVSNRQLLRADSNLSATQGGIQQSQSGAGNIGQPAPAVPPQASQPMQPTRASDVVYYCGAVTKKGTPCSRRVKRAGERCWQHTGMPSMRETADGTRK